MAIGNKVLGRQNILQMYSVNVIVLYLICHKCAINIGLLHFQ